ncbi:hypothetical protein ALC53_12413 [Atta colombica]|uniref:Uncharacterized protein n=1 Tax=Atta colombica TaxID=520822 RepID=A0A195AXZ2_9HYME|nr:hypothetical protein ALC53_12413 [Atta colombica]
MRLKFKYLCFILDRKGDYKNHLKELSSRGKMVARYRKTLKKSEVWFRYIDDIRDMPNILFTVDIEKNRKLPFLDVLVSKKVDGTLGHQMYRKSTHTDRYLHAESYYCLA